MAPHEGEMEDSASDRLSRIAMARSTARELLNDLETGRVGVAACLMKAKRLARLMRDRDAQFWLDLEMRGYPSGFSFSKLGTCQHFAREGGRLSEDNKYWTQSLPELEGDIRITQASMAGLQFPSHIAPSASSQSNIDMAGMNVKAAVTHLTDSFMNALGNREKRLRDVTKLFHGLTSALHNYATETHLALEVGDIAEDIFEQARGSVDQFIRATCPESVEQLVAIHERMREGSDEALAQALTSCRRILAAVADAVFPPKDTPYEDATGTERRVGKEQYKNRLLAFIGDKVSSDSTKSMLGADIEHLAARLDAVYEKACKGVHADVTAVEARLAIIETYIFLAEVARAATITEPA